MAENEQPGFLRKVLKFVANPATDWSKLDRKDDESQQSGYSKNEIKEIIERKRRNDFVRKREFDMLRKLRSKEANAAQVLMRASQFGDSKVGPASTPDERASTLRKIDEIEAQMSMQWWRTKQAGTSSTPQGMSSIPESNLQASASPAARAPNPALMETQPPSSSGHHGHELPPQESATASGPKPVALSPLAFQSTEGFSASKLMVEIEEVTHDADLEEAAIRFANGDSPGAEAALKELIHPSGSRARHSDTWLTLFDLYRATGDQHSFESLALDYADLFGQSSPTWVSLPALAGMSATKEGSPSSRQVTWKAPKVLSPTDVTNLVTVLKRSPQPYVLDWRALKEISDAAVAPLTGELNAWAESDASFRFLSAKQFPAVLSALTPTSQKETPQSYWQLRLAALRVMHMADEFDMAALDFCITYEVSPPGWTPAKCTVALLDTTASAFMSASSSMLASADMGPSSGSSEPMSISGDLSDAGPSAELSGVLDDNADDALAALDSNSAQTIQIDCSRLVRIDFAAAGALLNWTLERHAQGREVVFLGLHRLIALFLGVVGVTGHATVAIRRD